MFHVKQKRVAFRCSAGACLLCRLPTLPFVYLPVPIPPTPFPRGEGGDFWLSYARGSAPCIPGVEPGRRWLAGRLRPAHPCYRSRAALVMPSERKLINFIKAPSYQKCPCQCIFMKVLGGSGDSFKSPPAFLPPKKSG